MAIFSTISLSTATKGGAYWLVRHLSWEQGDTVKIWLLEIAEMQHQSGSDSVKTDSYGWDKKKEGGSWPGVFWDNLIVVLVELKHFLLVKWNSVRQTETVGAGNSKRWDWTCEDMPASPGFLWAQRMMLLCLDRRLGKQEHGKLVQWQCHLLRKGLTHTRQKILYLLL